MKVSDYVIEFLVQNKIDQVFSYIGKNAHLCDSIDKHDAINNVFTIHEQGAGFAADAYARVTGKTGVSTVTSGPGGTNLVTSIADCYFDAVPTMFIVGDLPPDECKGEKCIRQFGFQETDMVSIVKSITKYAVAIDDLHDLRYKLEKAYFLSQEGRKGPVLISLPENLQFKTEFYPDEENSFFDSDEYKKMIENTHHNIDRDVETTAELINKAKRPVILIGGGVRQSLNADLELKQFLDKTNIPIVYSLMGKDVIKHDYTYNLGFIGSFGNRYSNLTLANADLLIVLGSRLDYLQTGRNIDTFAREAKIIQVDIDQHELGLRLHIDLPVLLDVKTFLNKLNKDNFTLSIDTWQEKVLQYKERYPSEYGIDKKVRIGNKIISELSQHLRDDDIICVDVGEHQMLVAQSLKMKGSQRVLFSGGFGAMGFALPAAIGATLGTGRRAVVISGDGGFQMNIQELEVLHRRNLPIKMFIIDNASLHMVKLRQDTFLKGNCVGSKKDYSVPSFKKVGEAYGIKSHEVSSSNIEEIREIINKSLQNDDCEIIDIQLEGSMTTVEPRLDFNRSFEDMSPYLSREELEERMVIKKKKLN